MTTFTQVSRVAGSDAGGGPLIYLAVTGAVGVPNIFFGAALADPNFVTVISPTLISCKLPPMGSGAATGGSLVNVTCGSQTLTNGFEYHPHQTGSFFSTVSHNFEDGLLAPFTTFDSTVTTTHPWTGAKSVEQVFASSGDALPLLKGDFANNNLPALGVGHYLRWGFYVSTATKNLMSSGQIKMHLGRYQDNGGSTIGGWAEFGIGPNIPGGSQTTYRACVDQEGSNPNIGGAYSYLVDGYNEVVVWYHRDTVAHTGRCKVWVGNASSGIPLLVLLGDLTDSFLGLDSIGATDHYTFEVGAYSELAASYPLSIWHDDVVGAADGWVDPL